MAGGIGAGDRCLYLGLGRLRGRHGDVLSVRRRLAAVRLDGGIALWCRLADLHPIPRRPPPLW